MAKLNPCRTLTLIPSRSIPASGRRPFSAGARRLRPTNVGNLGLAEEDATIGKQAPEPLTLEGIEARRAKAGKLVAPTASYSDSDMFKSPHAYSQPKARRWDHLLSKESRARKPCILKQAAKHLKKPGLISLGGGLPSSEHFPFESLSMRIPTSPHFTEAETASLGQDLKVGKYDVARNENGGVFDLSIAMNYGQSVGAAQLLRFVTEHTELVCRPPYADWQSALTIGSTGALEQSLRMFCDRERGDSVLTEEYSFSTALETAEPLGIHVFGASIDEQGLLPEAMDKMLSNWNESDRGGARKPTVLYTVPSGQNPTGATMGLQRRREVYKVCQKHDIFIFEDEPYYFLQMPDYRPPHERQVDDPTISPTKKAEQETPQQFLEGMMPTLLSLDTDGRVLRMDSFSKVAIPGSRVGWVTGSEQVIERYIRHAECASQGPAGVAQLLMYKLVDEGWGHEGYIRWLMALRLSYTKRRDAMLDACERHLPKAEGVVTWVPPKAGMFLWLKVDHEQHPATKDGSKSILEIEEDIFDRCIEKGVLASRGSWFRAETSKPLSGLFFRTTFASASEEGMDEAIRRFGEAVRESFKM